MNAPSGSAGRPWLRRAQCSLLAIGLVQMAAAIAGADGLRAVASATLLSPAPKVFTAVSGIETFSSSFFVEWSEPGGERSERITPQRYAQLEGPYVRRNAYGAALAYGPVLATNPRTRAMLEAVLRRALGGDAPIARELGLDVERRTGPLRVRYEFPTGTPDPALPRVLEAAR